MGQTQELLGQKLAALEEFFRGRTVVVAYSGGVDSSVVMALAHRFAHRAVAVTANSITVLPEEVSEATKLAEEQGWEHRVVVVDELADENFAANPENRCYYCKAGLSKELQTIASEVGANLLVEGTNYSEVEGHRPGLQAIREERIGSPLLDHSLTKEEVRELAREFGLPNADKPNLACLSSRFPTGVRITPEKLQRVGQAERYLIDTYDLRTLRVRDHEGLARVEVAPEERGKLLSEEVLDDIHSQLRALGFRYVTLDCAGYRTGSVSGVDGPDSVPSPPHLSPDDVRIV